MKTFLGYAVLLGLAASTPWGLGCSSANPPGAESVGRVGLELELAPGVTISSVAWTITNATTSFSESGTVNVQSSESIAFQVGGLPSGSGYTIALTAATTDGTLSCAGSATFAISAGTTADVAVTLYCTGAADSGSAAVTGTTQVCANITTLSASPTETSVDSTVALSSAASAGSIAPTFAWTASAGTFSDPTSATPTFTCPDTPGPVTVTLTVSPSAAGCTTTSTESLTVTCDALAPTFTNVYATIISSRCTSCHQPGKGGVTTGMLDMSTQALAYADLVGVAAAGVGAGASGVMCASLGVDADGGPQLLRVVPGDSPDSLIYEKVNAKVLGVNPPCGNAMPASGAALTPDQVAFIAAWIDGGALNN
ncbi:MAG TPA: hypothetical protein VGM06_05675 [Polyangiaceae bacterium]